MEIFFAASLFAVAYYFSYHLLPVFKQDRDSYFICKKKLAEKGLTIETREKAREQASRFYSGVILYNILTFVSVWLVILGGIQILNFLGPLIKNLP
jgi:hypothetical protein